MKIIAHFLIQKDGQHQDQRGKNEAKMKFDVA